MDWFLRLIGLDPARLRASDGEYVDFTWRNMPESIGVFVLVGAVIAIGVAVIWLYLREINTCPTPVKLLLAGTRFLVLFILVLILLGPELRYTERQQTADEIYVMRDTSDSIDNSDQYEHVDDGGELLQLVSDATGKTPDEIKKDGVKRSDVINSLIKKDKYDFIDKLRARGKVRIIDFADQVSLDDTQFFEEHRDKDKSAEDEEDAAAQPAEDDEGELVNPIQGQGRASDIIKAINQVAGKGPAAVVVFTDGQHTAGGDLKEAGYYAKSKGVKLYIVGVGDPSRPRNLVVTGAEARPKVWPDEPFEISAFVQSNGIEARDVMAVLYEHKLEDGVLDPDDKGREVGRDIVKLPEAGGNVPARFTHAVNSPGKYAYTIKVDPVERERDETDNQAVTEPMEVVNEKVNVLLIAGAPTWEYRMLQRLLTRDQTIAVSCWLQTMDLERPQEGDLPISQLPRDISQLGKYHLVMMFDPNPNEFDGAWIELLKKYCSENAGGVLYMAGAKYTDLFLSLARTSGLKDILPVEFGEAADIAVAQLLSSKQEWPLKPVMQNADHPIMTFYQEATRNRDLWKEFPGVFWSFPSLGPKPTCQVLLEHGDSTLSSEDSGEGRPLLVSGRYGAGRSVYMGFNGTWRWRRVGRQAEFFDKFWLQTVRFLVETRTLKGRRHGNLYAEQETYEQGQRVIVKASLLDEGYEPLKLPEVDGMLIREDDKSRTPIVFKRDTDSEGEYEAVLHAEQKGDYTVSVRLGTAGSIPIVLDTTYKVRGPLIEQKAIWLNEPVLRSVAAASGGQYFSIGEMDKLAAAMPNTVAEDIVPGDTPEPLWDIRGVLVLFVLLLGVEWAVRKAFKLL